MPLVRELAAGPTIGTVWTLVVIPVIDTLLDDLSQAPARLTGWRMQASQGAQ